MERRQAWLGTAAVMVTVILSAIGATWVIGRNIADMATREDATRLQNEATRQRNEISPPLRNLATLSGQDSDRSGAAGTHWVPSWGPRLENSLPFVFNGLIHV